MAHHVDCKQTNSRKGRKIMQIHFKGLFGPRENEKS